MKTYKVYFRDKKGVNVAFIDATSPLEASIQVFKRFRCWSILSISENPLIHEDVNVQ